WTTAWNGRSYPSWMRSPSTVGSNRPPVSRHPSTGAPDQPQRVIRHLPRNAAAVVEKTDLAVRDEPAPPALTSAATGGGDRRPGGGVRRRDGGSGGRGRRGPGGRLGSKAGHGRA